jgi:ribosomal protein S18 acetylase RimI-like enzyme
MANDVIAALETALLEQWHHFGRGPGAAWREDADLTWLESPVAQLPYNGVFRTRLPASPEADERIRAIVEHYRERAVDFLWIVHPTAAPADLGARLDAAGVARVEAATGMALELVDWSGPSAGTAPGIRYVEPGGGPAMDHFEDLIAEYWALAPQARDFVFGVNRAAGIGTDAYVLRWVAYADDEPAGKSVLSLVGGGDTAAIFGVFVPERFRGRGIASGLMDEVISRARDLGLRRLVLHSTEMAVGMYRRIGFRDVAPFHVHATAGLHSLQPS